MDNRRKNEKLLRRSNIRGGLKTPFFYTKIMGKKILGFILGITFLGFILMFTFTKEWKTVKDYFPKNRKRKELIKLVVINSAILIINICFWLFILRLWQ